MVIHESFVMVMGYGQGVVNELVNGNPHHNRKTNVCFQDLFFLFLMLIQASQSLHVSSPIPGLRILYHRLLLFPLTSFGSLLALSDLVNFDEFLVRGSVGTFTIFI